MSLSNSHHWHVECTVYNNYNYSYHGVPSIIFIHTWVIFVGFKFRRLPPSTKIKCVEILTDEILSDENFHFYGINKPSMVMDYIKYMGGVDIADQFVTYYGFTHCYKKWWKWVFFYLLEMCSVNAYIVHSSTCSGRQLTHMDFILLVARQLLEISGSEVQFPEQPQLDQPMRLVGRNHFPEPSGKRNNCCEYSNHQCTTHKATLCIHQCFKRYHTIKQYKAKWHSNMV